MKLTYVQELLKIKEMGTKILCHDNNLNLDLMNVRPNLPFSVKCIQNVISVNNMYFKSRSVNMEELRKMIFNIDIYGWIKYLITPEDACLFPIDRTISPSSIIQSLL